MSTNFILEAELRSDTGKGASRRLRRNDLVPGILYGGNAEAVMISLQQNTLQLQLRNEAFYSHILTLKVGGKEEQAVLKDVHRHPYKQQILHIDLQRISQDKAIHVHVPLHYVNEDKCVGVKLGGGIVRKILTEVEVSCLPRDLPEYIEIDIENLQLGQSVHLTEIKLPVGVQLLALMHGTDHDMTAVTVIKPRTSEEEKPVAEVPEGTVAAG